MKVKLYIFVIMKEYLNVILLSILYYFLKICEKKEFIFQKIRQV